MTRGENSSENRVATGDGPDAVTTESITEPDATTEARVEPDRRHTRGVFEPPADINYRLDHEELTQIIRQHPEGVQVPAVANKVGAPNRTVRDSLDRLVEADAVAKRAVGHSTTLYYDPALKYARQEYSGNRRLFPDGILYYLRTGLVPDEPDNRFSYTEVADVLKGIQICFEDDIWRFNVGDRVRREELELAAARLGIEDPFQTPFDVYLDKATDLASEYDNPEEIVKREDPTWLNDRTRFWETHRISAFDSFDQLSFSDLPDIDWLPYDLPVVPETRNRGTPANQQQFADDTTVNELLHLLPSGTVSSEIGRLLDIDRRTARRALDRLVDLGCAQRTALSGNRPVYFPASISEQTVPLVDQTDWEAIERTLYSIPPGRALSHAFDTVVINCIFGSPRTDIPAGDVTRLLETYQDQTDHDLTETAPWSRVYSPPEHEGSKPLRPEDMSYSSLYGLLVDWQREVDTTLDVLEIATPRGDGDHFQSELRKARKALQLTQTDVAEEIHEWLDAQTGDDVSPVLPTTISQRISNYEREKAWATERIYGAYVTVLRYLWKSMDDSERDNIIRKHVTPAWDGQE